jgi:S-adenosyl-L-methionine hydrolase (adenosine-forming)
VPKPIVFLSDLGLRDEFVGVCHSVIARIAPGTTVIDLTHGVPPQDVTLGAVLLAESLPFGPPDAVILAVVDPGVGTDRKAVAVETGSDHLLVGPDNGLLSIAWDALGGATRAFSIDSPNVLLAPVSKVFHGRDVFAPAAAALAGDLPIEELGPPVDVASLVRIELPEPEVEEGRIRCQVLDVDRFGNVQLNVRPEHLDAAALDGAPTLLLNSTSATTSARKVDTYGAVGSGEYGVLADAWGWLSIVRFEANAAGELDVREGDPIWIATPETA